RHAEGVTVTVAQCRLEVLRLGAHERRVGRGAELAGGAVLEIPLRAEEVVRQPVVFEEFLSADEALDDGARALRYRERQPLAHANAEYAVAQRVAAARAGDVVVRGDARLHACRVPLKIERADGTRRGGGGESGGGRQDRPPPPTGIRAAAHCNLGAGIRTA